MIFVQVVLLHIVCFSVFHSILCGNSLRPFFPVRFLFKIFRKYYSVCYVKIVLLLSLSFLKNSTKIQLPLQTICETTPKYSISAAKYPPKPTIFHENHPNKTGIRYFGTKRPLVRIQSLRPCELAKPTRNQDVSKRKRPDFLQ